MRCFNSKPAGAKKVPSVLPSIICGSRPGVSPHPINTAQPDFVATLAASILVAIPPIAVGLVVPSAIFSISELISLTNGTSTPEFTDVIKPFAVVRIIRSSACVREARRADNMSLSPNFNSSSLIESFSLTTGTTPLSSRESIVSFTFIDLASSLKSSRVNKIWAAKKPWALRADFHACISSLCPTEAHERSTDKSSGLEARPSFPMPKPTAPELTSTTSIPCFLSRSIPEQI